MTSDEAKATTFKNISQSVYDGWMRNADSDYKPLIVDSIISDSDTRNAALNIMYQNYIERNPCYEGSFKEFVNTPVEMYRGGHGQQHTENDIFSSYSFDKKIADKFAGSDGKVYTAKIRPIDTYGSLSTNGESEIFVPSEIAPNGNVDGVNENEDNQ